jgi:hypothetical protein
MHERSLKAGQGKATAARVTDDKARGDQRTTYELQAQLYTFQTHWITDNYCDLAKMSEFSRHHPPKRCKRGQRFDDGLLLEFRGWSPLFPPNPLFRAMFCLAPAHYLARSTAKKK